MRLTLVLLFFLLFSNCGSFEIVTREPSNVIIYSYEQPYYYQFYRPNGGFYQYSYPRRYYIPNYTPSYGYYGYNNRYYTKPKQRIRSRNSRGSSPRVIYPKNNPKPRPNVQPRRQSSASPRTSRQSSGRRQ